VSDPGSSLTRQYQKIDVNSFSHWSDTQLLLKNSLGAQFESKGPTTDTVLELHNLCAGNPAELQLYGFHMYRQMELANNERMELTAAVYREVAMSYRSSSSPLSLKAVKAFERISKTAIPTYPWLQNCSLTAEENILLQIARRELELALPMPDSEVEVLSKKVAESYQLLFRYGISLESNTLRLYDEACLKGFWKSSVKLESGEQWTWNEQSFGQTLIQDVQKLLGA
jgi:hypothetical protein